MEKVKEFFKSRNEPLTSGDSLKIIKQNTVKSDNRSNSSSVNAVSQMQKNYYEKYFKGGPGGASISANFDSLL